MENTINTATMLVGEGALLPESLRFESEPWTFFYMAGGIIRQLRKALENKRANALRPSIETHKGQRTAPAGQATQLNVATNLNL